MSTKRKQLRLRAAVFVCCSAVLVGVDQITKFLAQTHLSATTSKPLIPGFVSLRLLYNPGATLGMGSTVPWLVALVELSVCVAFMVLAALTTSWWWTFAFAFAFSGALGNLIDRIVYAHGFLNGVVVDFLNYGWSVGNVADVELTVAAVLIVLGVLFSMPFFVKGEVRRDKGSSRSRRLGRRALRPSRGKDAGHLAHQSRRTHR
ncbi:MAG: signal peptidase II [Bifidobacteriaceae bacterium]|nr:signal peptidase II [Bifidobacteriaceae bacterium]